jgi:hypothetical protein
MPAWVSAPSAYTVAARTRAGVVVGANFARDNRIRFVVSDSEHHPRW